MELVDKDIYVNDIKIISGENKLMVSEDSFYAPAVKIAGILGISKNSVYFDIDRQVINFEMGETLLSVSEDWIQINGDIVSDSGYKKYQGLIFCPIKEIVEIFDGDFLCSDVGIYINIVV